MKDRRGYDIVASCDEKDIPITTTALPASRDPVKNSSASSGSDINYTDYVSSRASSIDDNSATLPHSNRKMMLPPNSMVELSSLFRAEDDGRNSNEGGGNRSGEKELPQKSLLMDDENDTDDHSESSNGSPPPTRRRRQRENGKAYRSLKKSWTSPGKDDNNGGGVWGSFMMNRQSSKQSLFQSPVTALMGKTGEFSTLGSIREEGSDAEDEDPIMEVMDFLEDEIDEHTYDELIPLQIRMALEDQVFGWDHFFSNILGHVGYTVGSYLLTFWIITLIGKTASTSAQSSSNEPWRMPHELFSFIRTALSIASAISTFRTIRRRRRVWLRPSHGGSAAKPGSREFKRQQSTLEEADRRARRFVLGSKLWAKMQRSYMKRRDRYLSSRVHRRLLKAQRMFERRHRNRVKLIRSASATSLVNDDVSGSGKKRAVASALTRHGHESSHHERVRMLAATPQSSVSNSWEEDDNGSLGGESTDVTDYHSAVPPGRNSMDSRTLPNFAMESVSHDQMPFAHGEIKKIPYVHGGFFGAAPFMLTNPHWIGILRILMPDVYVEISRRASYAPAPRLIHWAENNPVVAAYGTAHEIEFSGRVPTLEWDVFLDPYLVKRVEVVLNEKEAFLQRRKSARKKSLEPKRHENDAEDTGDEDAKVLKDHASKSNSTPINAADERLVLSYYDKEIKRRTTLLVDRMLIAHGNVAQLVLEQTGYLKKYNFSRVKRTCKTLGGGIFCRQWMAVYSEAMKLGMDDEDDFDDEVSDSGTDGSLEEPEVSESWLYKQHDDFPPTDDDDNQNEDAAPGERGLECMSPDFKSVTQSLDAGSFRTPSRDEAGPPRKIVMMRSNDERDDDTSLDGSINSEPSLRRSRRTAKRRGTRRKRQNGRKTPTKALERVDATSLRNLSAVPDKSISESISILKPILQCSAPFGLVMDMKSRHVSRRIWALVIDFLRDSGARVEGIASFIVEEVRDITQYCSSPVNEIVFIHTAGNLQHWCHTGEIKRGDKVFFNAGSLLWDYPNLYNSDTVKKILWHGFQPYFDEQEIKEGYSLKPYAKTTNPSKLQRPESQSEGCDESTLLDDDDGDSLTSDLFARLLIDERKKKSLSEVDFVFEEAPDGVCSTIQQYKEYYQLSIGLYVQEFAIDEVAISLIVKYVNSNLHVFDLGLSWGGINGLTVKGIQPGRFTATDGLWNQRYGDMPWKRKLKPGMEYGRVAGICGG